MDTARPRPPRHRTPIEKNQLGLFKEAARILGVEEPNTPTPEHKALDVALNDLRKEKSLTEDVVIALVTAVRKISHDLNSHASRILLIEQVKTAFLTFSQHPGSLTPENIDLLISAIQQHHEGEDRGARIHAITQTLCRLNKMNIFLTSLDPETSQFIQAVIDASHATAINQACDELIWKKRPKTLTAYPGATFKALTTHIPGLPPGELVCKIPGQSVR